MRHPTRRRLGRSRPGFAGAPMALAVFIAVVLAACGGDAETRDAASAETDPGQEQESGGEPQTFDSRDVLEPGTYVADTFDPHFTFSIGEEGAVASMEEPGFLDLGLVTSDPPFRLIFVAVAEAFDPEQADFISPPDDLEGWLTANPSLEAAVVSRVTFGGIEGTRVDVRPGSQLYSGPGCLAADPCSVLFRAEGGLPLHVHDEPSEEFLRGPLSLYLLDVEGQPFVVALDTEADLDAAGPAAESLLQTVQFRT